MIRFSLLLLISFGLIACGDQQRSDTSKPPAKVVVVAPVEKLSLPRHYSLTGTTRAVDRATVAPQVSGVLAKCPVNLGDRVTRGDLIARLDNPELAPALKAAVARLAELRLQHAQAERDYVRVNELFARGVVTKRETEQAKTQRDALTAAVNSAEAEVARSRRLVAETELHAPISGEIERIDFEPGEFVPAGQGMIAVAGDAVEVEFGVPETLLSEVAVGQTVTLTLPLFGDRTVEGRIIEMGNKVTLPARLFPVVIALEQEKGVRPGLTVAWTLNTADAPHLMVPLQALASPAGATPRVYRLVKGRVEAVPVVTGEVNGERVTVEGNLTSGDEIVVAGLNSLVDGQAVEVQR